MSGSPEVVVNVSAARLAELVERLGAIGAQPGGGIIRHQYSESWVQAQDFVAELMAESGLVVRRDAVGNVYGRLPGRDDSRTILTGSHIDAVVMGGAFDGALGVLSAVTALETLAREHGRPERSVEAVSLCEEEGGRFHANYFGTRAILGLIGAKEAEQLVDRDGISLGEAARSVGLDPGRFGEAQRDDLDAFLELHIEQGRTLVDAGIDVGVVDVITGLSWLEVTVTGRVDHAGATAMHDRLDAFQGAAVMARAVDRVVKAQGAPAVGTVGAVHVWPNATNIVPGSVEFSVDVRYPDELVLASLVESITQDCQRIAEESGLTVQLDIVKQVPPLRLERSLSAVLEEAAGRCGASSRILPSGAGHDSQVMGHEVPTAMLFIPSVDGRSHSPAEYSTPEDCGRGASVLATALHALAW